MLWSSILSRLARMLTSFTLKVSSLILIWRSTMPEWLAMANFLQINIHWRSSSTFGSNLFCLALAGTEMFLRKGSSSFMMIQFVSILPRIWITSAKLQNNGKRRSSTAKWDKISTILAETTRTTSRSQIAKTAIPHTGQPWGAKMRKKLEQLGFNWVSRASTIFYHQPSLRNPISLPSSRYLKVIVTQHRTSQWFGATIRAQISAKVNGVKLSQKSKRIWKSQRQTKLRLTIDKTRSNLMAQWSTRLGKKMHRWMVSRLIRTTTAIMKW